MSLLEHMTCPEGGRFFACTDRPNGFVGCCDTEDACTAQGCGAPRPTSYNSTALGGEVYSMLHNQGCSRLELNTFWSCNGTFWGCCKWNACAYGCNSSGLDTAYLLNEQSAWTEIFGEPTESTEPSESSNTGAIIGGAVGGGVAVLLVVALLIWWVMKKRKDKAKGVPATVDPNNPNEMRYSAQPTLVSSDYGGSPKWNHGSPVMSQYTHSRNAHSVGSAPSPYIGTPQDGTLWPHQQYAYERVQPNHDDPNWPGIPLGYTPPQQNEVIEIGDSAADRRHEMG